MHFILIQIKFWLFIVLFLRGPSKQLFVVVTNLRPDFICSAQSTCLLAFNSYVSVSRALWSEHWTVLAAILTRRPDTTTSTCGIETESNFTGARWAASHVGKRLIQLWSLHQLCGDQLSVPLSTIKYIPISTIIKMWQSWRPLWLDFNFFLWSSSKAIHVKRWLPKSLWRDTVLPHFLFKHDRSQEAYLVTQLLTIITHIVIEKNMERV